MGTYGSVLAEEAQSDAEGDEDIAVSRVLVEGERLRSGEPARLRFRLRVRRPFERLYVQLGITSFGGQNLVLEGLSSSEYPELAVPGTHTLALETSPLWLRPRSYTARVKILADSSDGSKQRFTSDWTQITVEGTEVGCAHASSILAPEARWSIRASRDVDTADGTSSGPVRAARGDCGSSELR